MMASASATVRKEEPPPEWITAQHVLVAYKGAAKCPRNVTRSKDEARKRADEARAKAVDGSMDFGEVAALYSDDPNGKERQGSLGKIKRENVVATSSTSYSPCTSTRSARSSRRSSATTSSSATSRATPV